MFQKDGCRRVRAIALPERAVMVTMPFSRERRSGGPEHHVALACAAERDRALYVRLPRRIGERRTVRLIVPDFGFGREIGGSYACK